MSFRTGRDSSSIWQMFLQTFKRKNWEEPLYFLRIPSLTIGRMLERLVRGLMAPESAQISNSVQISQSAQISLSSVLTCLKS